MTHTYINTNMAPDLNFVADSVATPELKAAKTTDNLTCLIIKTGSPDRIAHFYPALYQLTLIRNSTEEKIELGFSGSRLLERLARNPGEVVGREDLLSHAWSDRVVGQGSLNQQIYTLRQILGDEKDREIIQTLPRRGYQLNPNCVEVSVMRVPPPAPEPVVMEVATSVESLVTTNATPTAKPVRRWTLLTTAAGVALAVLAFTWHNHYNPTSIALVNQVVASPSDEAQASQATSIPELHVTYTTQDPDELAALRPTGERLSQHFQTLLKQSAHVIVGMHNNMLDITCLSHDGTARALHFPPAQIEQLASSDLRNCLP